MIISGFIKNSFVDYPSQISSVIFTQGCNYNCHYCHNSQLIQFSKGTISEKEIFDFLQQRKGLIDAVVISGGEPTCQKDLIDFIKKIKLMGFLVKLDTNGTNFEVLKNLIENNLIDYVAMDIKAPFDKYNEIVGQKISDSVKKSIEYLIKCNCNYEFRTTLSPKLNEQDLFKIFEEINGAILIYLQKCNLKNDKNENKYTFEKQNEIIKISSKFVKKCIFRGF